MITFMMLAASAAMTPTAVSAQALPQARVYHGDLNLATHAGRKMLRARIERAGLTICGSGGILDHTAQIMVDDCRAAVRESARPQVREAVIAASSGVPMRVAVQTATIAN